MARIGQEVTETIYSQIPTVFIATSDPVGLSLVESLARPAGNLTGFTLYAGRRTVNTEPLPGSLVTVTSPPIMRASLRVMARPSPVPPKRCAVVASAWVNSSNSFACCSGGHADAGVGDRELDEAAAIAHLACRKLDLALLW